MPVATVSQIMSSLTPVPSFPIPLTTSFFVPLSVSVSLARSVSVPVRSLAASVTTATPFPFFIVITSVSTPLSPFSLPRKRPVGSSGTKGVSRVITRPRMDNIKVSNLDDRSLFTHDLWFGDLSMSIFPLGEAMGRNYWR